MPHISEPTNCRVKDPSASWEHFQDSKDPDAEELQEVNLTTYKDDPEGHTSHLLQINSKKSSQNFYDQ
jgi:hypothetical protein